MKIPAVSVVVSVFNGEHVPAEAVESILDQSFRDFEFIIVNDGSTDHTGAILEDYQKRDARVRVYHQENKGLVESLNRGCRLARGEYIARMDADDVAMKDRLLWQVDFMQKNPEVSVLGGAVQVIDSAGRHLATSVNPVVDQEIKSALVDRCPFWHPTVMMRKHVFSSVGGYRPEVPHSGDTEMWLRFASAASIGILQDCQSVYRRHRGNMSRAYTQLRDPQQRKTALDIFFDSRGHAIANTDHVRRRLFWMLAGEIVDSASGAFNRGEFALSEQMAEFALEVCSHFRTSVRWLTYECKRMLGLRASNVLRGIGKSITRRPGELS